ncbi:MAG: Tol-Pal system beta propeller repeat protein TolB [Robiginitomaculum sp.]|nr:MAG: Tol-Pal system beta propeller repeat protein TolB [Robiginitomaculum sp.]
MNKALCRARIFSVLAFVAIWSLSMFASSTAHAQLEIDIVHGAPEPVPVAIPDFLSSHPATDQIAKDMAIVIAANLERSGLFSVLDQSQYIEKQTDIDFQPRFADWRLINIKALLSGAIVQENPNRLKVEFRLWDIYAQQQLEGKRLATTPDNWRRIAHKISDYIYKRLTGESGYFDSRIVYIAESGPKTNRRKRLAIMDADGANARNLLANSDLVLTPRFSPVFEERGARKKVQLITYLSWETGGPQVFLQEIETGNRELLGNFSGMTISPRFSPDGQKLIFSMVKRGNSDIYVFDRRSRSTTRLTTNQAIDVSPSFSPNGRKIVFNSDRGGSPQLYIMNADGSNVLRLSFGDGRYTAPAWSPRGDLIAFTKSNKGQFHIGVMDNTGKGERLLTNSYLDEGPTWSPNGRVILFTRETRGVNARASIWSVDLTGRNLRRVPTPGGASDPAWSPILP